jgi:hypothetical protein
MEKTRQEKRAKGMYHLEKVCQNDDEQQNLIGSMAW